MYMNTVSYTDTHFCTKFSAQKGNAYTDIPKYVPHLLTCQYLSTYSYSLSLFQSPHSSVYVSLLIL